MHTRVALGHQLRAELERFWPGPIGLFTNLTSPISLAFIERYPSPVDARGLGEQRFAAFLKRERYRGGKTPSQLLAKLRGAAEGRAGEAELERSAHDRARARRRAGPDHRPDHRARAADRRRDSRPSRRRDLPLVLPLPRPRWSAPRRCSQRSATAARRYPTADSLAGDAGQAPVAIESGKRKIGAFRWRCDHRLRSAFGVTLRHHPPLAPLGGKIATPTPAPADTTTHARSAPSAAPGAACSGAAGKTAPHTTQPATAACNATPPSPSRPRRAPGPTSPPPSGWPAPPSPKRRPAGPSAQRLTASRQPLTHSTLDTGRLAAAWRPASTRTSSPAA